MCSCWNNFKTFVDASVTLHTKPAAPSDWSSCGSSSEDAKVLSKTEKMETLPQLNTHTYIVTNNHTNHQKNKSWESAFFFFKYLFLSLMYLQALICSVGLKYYKHFSDPGHLIFKVAFFAHFHLNVSGLFVCVSFWQFSGLTCIASWMHTSTSHEVYVHY